MRPHEPERSRLTVEQRPIYEQGYYMALVMALRCMQLARRTWGSMMEERTEKPRVVPLKAGRVNGHEVLELATVPPSTSERALAAAFWIFVVELLVGMAVLIVRAAR